MSVHICNPCRVLTVLREHPPARHEAAGPRGEGVGGSGHTHGLYQLVEEDGGADLQQGDVVVGGELVVLRVLQDAADLPRGGGVASRVHDAHTHVGTPGAGVRVPVNPPR